MLINKCLEMVQNISAFLYPFYFEKEVSVYARVSVAVSSFYLDILGWLGEFGMSIIVEHEVCMFESSRTTKTWFKYLEAMYHSSVLLLIIYYLSVFITIHCSPVQFISSSKYIPNCHQQPSILFQCNVNSTRQHFICSLLFF